LIIQRNAIANYVGQLYTTLIVIIITPLYLKYLGSEAYGLVGFFALMQAWMALLDMGLSPTLGRQVALARGVEKGFIFFKRLLKSFELIFLGVALFIALGVYFSAGFISQSWIVGELIGSEIIIYCIVLMGIITSFRWFAGLYRSGINGLEDQVWLNGASIVIVSLRFIGALVLLAFFTQDVRHFFLYQLFVGIFEVILFAWRFYTILPMVDKEPTLILFDWDAVKSVAPFALGIAYTAGIWVLVTQTDKLILSSTLSLAEFGYFSLVALVAGGINALAVPISLAIMPRMTSLVAENKNSEMVDIYRQASQLVTLVSFTVAMFLGLYAEIIIYAWTNDEEAAAWGAQVLIWFALGNGILSVSAFQYYLQNVFGQLRLHVIGSTISAVIQVPIIYWAAVNSGAIGAGIAWFCFRSTWFLLWTPIVHRKFIPGFHVDWLFKDILPIIGVITILGWLLSQIFPLSIDTHRGLLFLEMGVLGLFLLLVSAPSAPIIRKLLLQSFTKKET